MVIRNKNWNLKKFIWAPQLFKVECWLAVHAYMFTWEESEVIFFLVDWCTVCALQSQTQVQSAIWGSGTQFSQSVCSKNAILLKVKAGEIGKKRKDKCMNRNTGKKTYLENILTHFTADSKIDATLTSV